MVIGVFLICFLALFLCSRFLTETISWVFFRLFHSQKVAIQLLAILFLPGVIIHELAHWLVASIFFVPTGEIEFFPQAQENSVKLGSVQIAKTDPFRRFIIGIAPVLVGLGVIGGVFWYIAPTLFPITLKTIIFFYTVFEVGNTMFSSKKDLEGIAIILILAFLAFFLLLFLKVPIISLFLSFSVEPHVEVLVSELNSFLVNAIGLDVIIICVLQGLGKLTGGSLHTYGR